MLQALASFARRHYRGIFLGGGSATLVSLLLAVNLSFDTDVLNLLPRGVPEVDTYRQTLEHFGGVDLLLLIVRVPEGQPAEPYGDFVDRLATRLDESPLLGEVDVGLGQPEEIFRAFLPRAPLFLDAAGRAALEERLSPRGLRDRAAEVRRFLSTPQGIGIKELLRLDPLGMSETLLASFGSPPGALQIDLSSGYYLSQDHTRYLVLAKPVRPAQDLDFDRELVDAVESSVDEVARAFSSEARMERPEVVLGGTYLTALDDISLIRGDVILNTATAMVGVLTLFLVAFRRKGPLLFAVVPLAAGLAWTFGFCALSLGVLSSATSGIAALLIGLAIDFVIVSYGRFVEERRAGADLDRALALMSGSSGRAVVVGGVTSAATFFAFGVTEFVGLRQMGLLAGIGILLCMAAVLLFLPAMLAWDEDRPRKRQRRFSHYLHGFGVEHLGSLVLRHPRTTVALCLAITSVAGVLALGLEFQDNIREMRAPGNRGVKALDEVAAHFGGGFEYMSLVVTAPDSGSALTLLDEATKGAEELVANGVIRGADSITSVIPPPARQQEVVAWLERHRHGGWAPAELAERLDRAWIEEGLAPGGFAEGFALLFEALEIREPVSLEDLAETAQGRRLVERYLRSTPEGWFGVVRLFPEPLKWKRRPPPETVALAEALGPRVEVTGNNVVSPVLRRLVRRDAILAATLGFLLVTLILWFDFGRAIEAALSLAPLVIGIVWMLGAMRLLAIRLNFMNVFVTTMIIGIGVDYGVHMVHRYREAGEAWARGVVETGKAIVLAALSTVVGFGSMALSRYPGLRSIGFVAILGAVCSALVAITLLPALFQIADERRQKADERRRTQVDARES